MIDFGKTAALDVVNHRVSFGVKVVYGVGQIAHSIKAIIFGIFSLYFYTTVLGLSGTLVGLAMAPGLLWDAFIDPVIGSLSDSSHGRFGKRHGFMLVGSAGMGFGFWAYFSPPLGLSTAALFGWLLITNLLIRTMTSIFGIPYYALGAELSQDYHERTSITAVRGALALLGTLAIAVLSFVLFFPTTTPGVDPKLNPDGYAALGLSTGLVMSLVGLISTFGTWSYRRIIATDSNNPNPTSWGRFLKDSQLAMQNPSFRRVFFSYSTFFFGTVINAILAIHFLTYYVRITASEFLSVFHLSFYVGALAGVIFWLNIAKVVEKRWIYFTGTLSTAALMCSAYLLLGENHLFGTENQPPLLIGHGLAGFFASVLWVFPASMIADIVDQDELATGQRREGIFFGLFNFGEQIAAGGALLVAGVLVDGFAGLVPGKIAQSAETVSRVAMLYSLLPSVLLVLSAFFILGYSLDRSRVAEIQQHLKQTD